MCCGRRPGPPTTDRGVSPGAPPVRAAGVLVHRGGGPEPGMVTLHHRHPRAVMVRGPVTGRAYVFSAGEPDQPVDARDAEGLLRTGHFARAPDPVPGPRGTAPRS